MKISALFLFSLFVFSVYSSYVVVNVTDTSSTFTDTVTLNFTTNQYVFSVPYVNSTNFNETLVAYIDIDSDSSETFNGTIDSVTLQISTSLSATNDYATAGELQVPVNLNATSEDASDCWVYKNAATDADTYYGFVVVTFTDSEADNTTGTVGIDVKINYQDSCDTSDLSNSGGNGWIWFVVIGVVAVVVVILIVAGVAGFLFYKKKNQQQFDLYNDS